MLLLLKPAPSPQGVPVITYPADLLLDSGFKDLLFDDYSKDLLFDSGEGNLTFSGGSGG